MMDKFNEKEPIIINSMEEFERLLPEIPPYSTLIIKDSIMSSKPKTSFYIKICEIIVKISRRKISYRLRYKSSCYTRFKELNKTLKETLGNEWMNENKLKYRGCNQIIYKLEDHNKKCPFKDIFPDMFDNLETLNAKTERDPEEIFSWYVSLIYNIKKSLWNWIKRKIFELRK